METGGINLEGISKRIGEEFPSYQVEVEKGMLWRLAEAVGDANPLWQDESRARGSVHGGLVASPALCISMMMYGFLPGVSIAIERGLDASHYWKFHKPIRPGDVIRVTSKLTDAYEKQGKKFGRMVFLVFETILTNQKGEKVCTHGGSMVAY